MFGFLVLIRFVMILLFFFFSSRRRHTRWNCDWSSDVCSSDLFAVECGPSGCRVVDKKSTNGTHLNGAKIQEAMLATGDEIKSGQTIFVVRIVPDDQLPASGAQVSGQASAPAQRETPPAPAAREFPAPAAAPVRAPVVSPS